MNRKIVLERISTLLAQMLPKGASAFLFGSQARGDFSSESDWDLLILLGRKGSVSLSEIGDFSLPIYQLSAEMGIDINPVVYTSEDWEKRSFTQFYKNVANDSIKIWG